MVYGVAHISINLEAWAELWLHASSRRIGIAMNTNHITIAPHSLLPLPEDDDTYIRRNDVPKYIPVAAQTLARWAVEGQGPRFIKLGRRLVAYRAGDLRKWLHSQSRQNTCQGS